MDLASHEEAISAAVAANFYTTGPRARGNADGDSHNTRLNLGHNIHLGGIISTEPAAGLR